MIYIQLCHTWQLIQVDSKCFYSVQRIQNHSKCLRLNIPPLKAQDLWGSKKPMSTLCSCQQIPGQFKCFSPILIKITGGPTPKPGPRSVVRGQLWPEPCGCMAYGYNLSLTRFQLNPGLGQPANPLATHSLKLHINDCWETESAKYNAMNACIITDTCAKTQCYLFIHSFIYLISSYTVPINK